MNKMITFFLLTFFSGSALCEESLASKLWQELELSKLPKNESEVNVQEELGPSDMAFLEDQLPTPKKEALASDFNSMATETDEVSLGQAAPIRRDERSQVESGQTIIRRSLKKKEEKNLFRERSRGEEDFTPTEFTPRKMRKRSH